MTEGQLARRKARMRKFAAESSVYAAGRDLALLPRAEAQELIAGLIAQWVTGVAQDMRDAEEFTQEIADAAVAGVRDLTEAEAEPGCQGHKATRRDGRTVIVSIPGCDCGKADLVDDNKCLETEE